MTQKYNVYNSDCPSHQLLNIIGDKWIILIIHKLSERTMRFGELKKAISGISPKVLSQSLHILQDRGLVSRQSYDERILKVEYSLTLLGKSLNTVCECITRWAEENIARIGSFQHAEK